MRVRLARSYIDDSFNVPGQLYPDDVHVDAPVGLVEVSDEFLSDWNKALADLWDAWERLDKISHAVDDRLVRVAASTHSED